jgi:hypothetical protein
MLRLVSTCFAAAVLTVPTLAQEPGPKANLTAKQALLQKVLRKMDSLPSCTFTAKVQNTRLVGAADAARPGAAPPAQLQAAGFAVATSAANAVMNVEGGWGADLLWASANEGKDQVLWHGRRMVGRQGEEPWRLRQGVVGNGTRMPKLFDPETFFQALLHSKLDVIHADVGALEDRPVEIVTVSLTGDDSYDVLWSGLVPDATTNSYLGTRSALAPAARARPEIEVDIARPGDVARAAVQGPLLHQGLVERGRSDHRPRGWCPRSAGSGRRSCAATGQAVRGRRQGPRRAGRTAGLPGRTAKARAQGRTGAHARELRRDLRQSRGRGGARTRCQRTCLARSARGEVIRSRSRR